MAAAFPIQAAAFPIHVNDRGDRLDANLADGVCATAEGGCTLRAAVQQANASIGHDAIVVEPGTYTIALLPPLPTDGIEGGDFDLTGSVAISGAGAGQTVIDAGGEDPHGPAAHGLDRLFEVHPTALDVALAGLTLRGGHADYGGAIQNWSPGVLRLEGVHVLGSSAVRSGGGLNNADPDGYRSTVAPPAHGVPSGVVEIDGSRFARNSAGKSGAAINNEAAGTINIRRSEIVENPGRMIPDPHDPEVLIPAPGVAAPGPAAVTNEGAAETIGTIRISGTLFARNHAVGDGAAVNNARSGNVQIASSNFEANFTEADGGALHSTGGTISVAGGRFTDNYADGNGGALAWDGRVTPGGSLGRFDVTDTVILRNKAREAGGGLTIGGQGIINLTGLTITGNFGGEEFGGLFATGEVKLTIDRSDFAGNTTLGEGGGASLVSKGEMVVRDSTFTGNKAGDHGEHASGGGVLSEGGPITISGTTFERNQATDVGGGASFDNHGEIDIRDTVVRFNRADADGGGIVNGGAAVTFERVHVHDNRAGGDGGGIHNESSGLFELEAVKIARNSAVNGGGLANVPDGGLLLRNSLIVGNIARRPAEDEHGAPADGGEGGGLLNKADGNGLIDSTTFSANIAGVRGGGLYHDADGTLKLSQATVVRNSAPAGGGIGVVESDFVAPRPVEPVDSITLRNSIVALSKRGGSCDWYLETEGGNVSDAGFAAPAEFQKELVPATRSCTLGLERDSGAPAPPGRDRVGDPGIDALADNGGPVETHALRAGSLATDSGVSPCPKADARGVYRPQNARCDSGAFEFEGAVPEPDGQEPETEYRSGPVQDGLETMAFDFTGHDDKTPASDLEYECRLAETDWASPENPLPPWMPLPRAMRWEDCGPPWQVAKRRAGYFVFEVRAIDRGGNADRSPAVHEFEMPDTTAPDTVLEEAPPSKSASVSATFTFEGLDSYTPPQFIEYECRLDSRDPLAWVDCVTPAVYPGLAAGQHTLEVRAYDSAGNVDRSPARHTWIVAPRIDCTRASRTVAATADAYVDQASLTRNFILSPDLGVGSSAPSSGARPGRARRNQRALVRFALPTGDPRCRLEKATLELYNRLPSAGRGISAIPLAGPFKESRVTWANQPPARGPTVTTVASAAPGYQGWNVTGHVRVMIQNGASHGWLLRDSSESRSGGARQVYASRELPSRTMPRLVLRYQRAAVVRAPRPPAPEVPRSVRCGEVLRESTLVANDLTNCPAEGLVIGAPDIHVDLGGHTVDGSVYREFHIEEELPEAMWAGIRNRGHDNVVVRNGAVREFGHGVRLAAGTARNAVEGLALSRNVYAGIEISGAGEGGNVAERNRVSGNGLGIALAEGSSAGVVRGNEIHGNAGGQIQVKGSSNNLFEGNLVVGVPARPPAEGHGEEADIRHGEINIADGSRDNVVRGGSVREAGYAGVVIRGGSHRTRVEAVDFARTGEAGVAIDLSDGIVVSGISARLAAQAGIVVRDSDGTAIRGNDLRYNASGVAAAGVNDLLIERNDASHSEQTGIEVRNGLAPRLIGNVASQTGGSGIALASGLDGDAIGAGLVRGNTASDNLLDGIEAAADHHEIAGNSAYYNGAIGIHAEGNRDGAGNLADGNGAGAADPQCVGVRCGPGIAPARATPDTSAPSTALVPPLPSDLSGDDSAAFRFTASDGPGGTPVAATRYECRLDPPAEEPKAPEHPPEPGHEEPVPVSDWRQCSSPVTYRALEPGGHIFEVRAIDAAQNKDLTPARHRWFFDPAVEPGNPGAPDRTEPQTRIADGPAAIVSEPQAAFHFTGSDNLTLGSQIRFECRLDSPVEAAFEPCGSPRALSAVANGNHRFEVRAVDRAGNRDSSPATRSWETAAPPADTIAPPTEIERGPRAVTVETAARFAFSSSDPAATFECSLDSAPFAACGSPRQYTGLAVGDHRLAVRAKDPAGNADSTPSVHAWSVTPPPIAARLSCGEVITRSTRLRNDLVNCPADGIVIGAPRITLDLDGRTVDGMGVAGGVRNDGHDSVTVKNGEIEGFGYGLLLNTGTERNLGTNLRLRSNRAAGAALGGVPQPADPLAPSPPRPPASYDSHVVANELSDSTLSGNDVGVLVSHKTRATVIDGNSFANHLGEPVLIEDSLGTTVTGNLIAAKEGVVVRDSSDNLVRSNTLDGAGVAIESTSDGAPSQDNVVESNAITGAGVKIEGREDVRPERNRVEGNKVRRANSPGIELDYTARNTISGNDVRFNRGGLNLSHASDNVIEHNNASRSGGDGIVISGLSYENVLRGSISSNNDGAGITVAVQVQFGQGALIEDNAASGNSTHGIDVRSPRHTIRDNEAHHNGGWGIYAGGGAGANFDGGGNRALGNFGGLDPATGRALQCQSINCGDGGGLADEIAPTTTLTGTPLATTEHAAAFRFTGADNLGGVTFQCRIDSSSDADWRTCLSPHTEILRPGGYTFEVRAVDTSGNPDPTPAKHSGTIVPPIPLVGPATTIETGPDPVTTSRDASFSFSADESGAAFECALDGAAWAPCRWNGSPPGSLTSRHTVFYTGLALGAHQFKVRASDSDTPPNAGAPAVYSWDIRPAPAAAEVSCGEVLVVSTLVTNDLSNCPGKALTIGAAGITVDLNAHTIDGAGAGTGIFNPGHDGVIVTNGSIRDFGEGVALGPRTGTNVVSSLRIGHNLVAGISLSGAGQGGTGPILRANRIANNRVGIRLDGGTTGALVRANRVRASDLQGVLVERSSANRIDQNKIERTGGPGIGVVGGHANTIALNELSDNDGGVYIGAETHGSDDNVVERNVISGIEAGVSVIESDRTRIAENSVSAGTRAGIQLQSSKDTLVRANSVSGTDGGIDLIESADNSRIELNQVVRTAGAGINVGELSPGTEILHNTVSYNSHEGIDVSDSQTPAQTVAIDGNEVDGNGADGIAVHGGGPTIKDNHVIGNRGWGIYAAKGGADLGGNAALGNAERSQCLNVVCRPGTPTGAPDTEILSGPSGTTSSRSAVFTYDGSDKATPRAALRFECRLDSSDWDRCDYPATVTDLVAGDHTFEIRAVDGAGIADPAPASRSWTYRPLAAGIAPLTAIDRRPERDSQVFAGVFTFHANEPDVTIECRVDSLAWEECGFGEPGQRHKGAFEYAFRRTEAGSHTFEARATDIDGNAGPAASYTWTIFRVTTRFLAGPGFTPATTGAPATGGPTRETAATIDFEADVADATFKCALDGPPETAAFERCKPPVSYSGLSIGRHSLQVVATDPAGNRQHEASIYEWVVEVPLENAPPETTIERMPPDRSAQTLFEFAGTDDETEPSRLRYQCRLDSTSELAWFDCPPQLSLLDHFDYGDPELAPGAHTFEVRAIDDSPLPRGGRPDSQGQADPSPATYTWTSTADTSPPSAEIENGPPSGARIGKGAATFAVAALDNATPAGRLRLQCIVDDEPWPADGKSNCASPFTAAELEPGPHTVRLRAVDLAGNIGPPDERTFTVVAAPVAEIVSGPASTTPSPSAVFKFTVDQSGSTFECSLDGADFAPCTSPRAYWGQLEDGPHRFEVRATNPEGVTQTDPTAREWTVDSASDTVAPNTRITRGPAATGTATEATFAFVGSDNIPGALEFECSLDGGDYEICTSPVRFANLEPGEHVLQVRAVDGAGNADPSPATRRWTITAPPPDCTADATKTSTVAADAWIDEGSPAVNLGGDSVLKVVSKEGQNTRALVRFDLPALPPRCVVKAAVLRLYAVSHSPARTIQALRADGAWTEDAVTWENQPPTTGAAATAESGDGWREFDVLGQTKAMRAGHNHGFLIGDTRDNGATEQVFSGREQGENEAQLVITFGPSSDSTDPETTLGLAPPATTGSTSAAFEFSSNEQDSSFECALDAGPFEACRSPKAYSGLPAGAHSFRVRAVDQAGNVDRSPITHTWTITEPGPGSCSAAPQTLAASRDAWVSQSSPASTSGSDSALKIDTKSQANARAFVAFELPAVPAGCSRVKSATLELYAASYKPGRTLEALAAGGNWSEDALNWSTQPAATGPAATASSPSSKGYVDWDVTAQARAMYTGPSNGFVIRDAAESETGLEQVFHSREKGADNPPRLVLTFD